jgi:hypothetical protein
MQTKMTVIVTAALLINVSIMGQSTGQIPGSVSGTVVDDSGKPVVGARIFISQALPASAPRPAAPPVITGPHVITTMTDYRGMFMTGHLLAGDYIACAQAPAQAVLDPCHWAASAPEFTVTAGSTTAGVKITMAKGAIVPIHLNDPQQLLASVSAAAEPDVMFHIVTAKGHHYPAIIVAQSATSRDHAVTVPFGTPLTLQVFSQHLVIGDETGQPAAAAGKNISVAAGSAAESFTFTVSGRK